MDDENFLPGLPVDLIRAAYLAAPGNEIESGKFASPESSAALVANAFGLFLDKPEALSPLPDTEKEGWPAKSITLEGIVRFTWSGGRHPCLDVLIETETALIGVESKRYEPFRSKSKSELSEAYWRPVWGTSMRGYEHVRDVVRDNPGQFTRLDAAQLVKHAFGLRSAVHRDPRYVGKKPILFYLYAEPAGWPDRREIPEENFVNHRNEISSFQQTVSDDEVSFVTSSYKALLRKWSANADALVNGHVNAVAHKFEILL